MNEIPAEEIGAWPTDERLSDKHSRDIFGLTVLKNTHPEIRRLKRQFPQAKLHGNKFWKSSVILMDYLRESAPEPGCEILEVGCGWGLSGAFCAKEFDAHVISLDADDSVFPFLNCHTAINGVETDTVQMRMEDVTVEQLAAFDIVIGADICFWDSQVDVVKNFIDRALEAGVGRIVLTDPGRPPFRELGEYFQEQEGVVYSDWDVPEPYNAWGLVLDIYNDVNDCDDSDEIEDIEDK